MGHIRYKLIKENNVQSSCEFSADNPPTRFLAVTVRPLTVRETAPLRGEMVQLHVIPCIMVGQLFQEGFIGQCCTFTALFKAQQRQSSTSGLPFKNTLEALMDGVLPWSTTITSMHFLCQCVRYNCSTTTSKSLGEFPTKSDQVTCNYATAMHICELVSCVFLSHHAECLLHILTCYCHSCSHSSRVVPALYEAFFLFRVPNTPLTMHEKGPGFGQKMVQP